MTLSCWSTERPGIFSLKALTCRAFEFVPIGTKGECGWDTLPFWMAQIRSVPSWPVKF